MIEKIAVIISISDMEKYHKSIESLVSQSYNNMEILLFTDDFLRVENFKSPHKIQLFPLKDYLNKEILASCETDYLFVLQENEFLSYPDSLEKMYSEMKRQQADCSISTAVLLKDGKFQFRFNPEIIAVNDNNRFFYTRRHFEFRKLSGMLMKSEHRFLIAESNQQEIVTEILEKSEHVIFDCHNHYVFQEEAAYSSEAYSWMTEKLPDFVKVNTYLDDCQAPQSKMSVAVCLNTNYAKYLPTLVYSLEKNNSLPIDLYIMYREIDAEMLNLIHNLADNLRKVQILFLPISTYHYNLLSAINRKGTKLPLETYYRFLLPELLPDLSRILYLDLDMLVVGNLSSLWYESFGENFLIGVADYPLTSNPKSWAYYFLDDKYGSSYINAGMLLYDLRKFRANHIFEQLLQFVLDTSVFYVLDDQDAYNMFFHGWIRLVDGSFNFVVSSMDLLPALTDPLRVIHYCGYSAPKPWRNLSYLGEKQYELVEHYRQYKQQIDKKMYRDCKLAIFIDGQEETICENVLENLAKQSFLHFDVYLYRCSGYSSSNVISINHLHDVDDKDCLITTIIENEGLYKEYDYVVFITKDVIFESDDWLRQLVYYVYDFNIQEKRLVADRLPIEQLSELDDSISSNQVVSVVSKQSLTRIKGETNNGK